MERRRDDDGRQRQRRSTDRRRADLETFEREYTIERFTQRQLRMTLGAMLWVMVMFDAIFAGRVAGGELNTWQTALQIALILISALGCIAMLTFVRRLDDLRADQVVAALLTLGLVIPFILSFYGPGALGAFVVATIAVSVFAAQFFNGRGTLHALVLMTVVSAVAAWWNQGTDYAPHFLSQMTLVVIINWAIAYATHIMREDRAQALADAERTAFSDSLTRLPNTRMLRRQAETLLHQRNERISRRTGLIVLDLDGFRAVNTLSGHREGNRVLQAVASALRSAAGSAMTVARTGSDEFSVLVPDTSPAALERLSEQMRETALTAADDATSSALRLDASIGSAISAPGGTTIDELLGRADQSLYLQKARRESEQSVGTTTRTARPAQPAPDPIPEDRHRRPTSRWQQMRWMNRPPQTRFVVMTWVLAGLSVLLALQMPDAVDYNRTGVLAISGVALLFTVGAYIVPPSTSIWRQLPDVVVGSLMLALMIRFTGGNSSAAVPIELLVLIYIGWFMPLPSVVPLSIFSIVIVLTPVLSDSSTEFLIMDQVTIYAGVVIAAVMLGIVYFNHYYIDRARTLTRQLAWFDPRAGIHNRRAFEDRLEEEIDLLSYGDRDALAVVLIDIGNFRAISASEGRNAADQVLSEVATALTAASREDDLVARLGGDEFAVVAPGVDAESAHQLARRLVDAARSAVIDSEVADSSAMRPSAGFALFGMHGRTTNELVTAADVALTAARTSGRDPERVSSYVVAL